MIVRGGQNIYGFTVGVQYDLQWPGSPSLGGIGGDLPCAGDNNLLAINQVLGQTSRMGEVAFNGASAYSYQITDDVRPISFTVGQSVDPGTGQKNGPLTKAINDRVAQDSDRTSPTYATYSGNGRRLVTVVVQSGFNLAATGVALLNSQQNVALGYAQFLLLPQVNGNDPYDSNPHVPFCAVYVGNSPEGGTTHTGFGGNGVGEAFVRLTQ